MKTSDADLQGANALIALLEKDHDVLKQEHDLLKQELMYALDRIERLTTENAKLKK